MRKNLKIICVIILLVAMIVPLTYSYAIETPYTNKNQNINVNEKHFFEISKLEVTKKDKIEMKLNLDYIKFNEFVFELKSDEDLENVEISQDNKIETEKNNNEIIMEISKEKTNIKTINFYYSIPDTKNVGDIIKFTATVTGIVKSEIKETDKNIDKDKIENEISVDKENKNEENKLVDNKQKNETENTEFKTEVQSIQFEVKIIEAKNNDNKQESQIPNKDDNKENDKQEIQNSNTDNIKDNNNQEIQKPNTDSEKEYDKQEMQKPSTNNVKEYDKQEVQNSNTNNIKNNDKQEAQLPNENYMKENNNQQLNNNNNNNNNNKQTPTQNNMISTINKGLTSNISYIQYNGIASQSFSSSQAIKEVTYNGSDNNYLSELIVNDYTLNKKFTKENTTYFMTVQNEIEKLDITASVEDSGATLFIYGNENLKQCINTTLHKIKVLCNKEWDQTKKSYLKYLPANLLYQGF